MKLTKNKIIIITAIVLIAVILIYVFRLHIKYYLFGGTQISSKFLGAQSQLPKTLKYENNVLNIRYSVANDWKGLVGNKNGFCLFNNAENCIRAGNKILDSYSNRNIKTIASIITTYAPPIENNTEKYIQDVVNITGFKRDEIIDSFNERAIILHAMSIIEVGQNNVPNLSVYKFAVKLK